MVAMLVSDNDGRDRFRCDSETAQPRDRLADAESAIDEKTRPIRFDQ